MGRLGCEPLAMRDLRAEASVISVRDAEAVVGAGSAIGTGEFRKRNSNQSRNCCNAAPWRRGASYPIEISSVFLVRV